MHRRALLTILGAAVVAAALGVPDRAAAAIRVTISDGSDTQVFYSATNDGLFLTAIGDYDLVIQSTLTNYPGQPTGAFLSQNIIISDDDPPSGTVLPTLTILAEVIDPVAGVVGSPFALSGASLTAVQAGTLALFTQPSASFLLVQSDVASAEPSGLVTTGTVQNITRMDGIPVPSLAVVVNSGGEAEQSAVLPNPDLVFTLTSEVILSGANEGLSGLSISAASGVFFIPEPGSMAVFGLGALGLGLVAVRRRWKKSD